MRGTALKTVCLLSTLILPVLPGSGAQAAPQGLPFLISPLLATDLSLTGTTAPAPITDANTVADLRPELPPLQPAPKPTGLRGRVDSAGDKTEVMRGATRYECVTFARMLTGLDLYGDAKTWWTKAQGLYARLTQPVEGAVMIFAGTSRLRHGHVAVVKEVVSKREVKVDHANWGNDGKIYLNTPVFDVSPKNDWSMVKVWNEQIHALGTHVYPLKGFVAE